MGPGAAKESLGKPRLGAGAGSELGFPGRGVGLRPPPHARYGRPGFWRGRDGDGVFFPVATLPR